MLPLRVRTSSHTVFYISSNSSILGKCFPYVSDDYWWRIEALTCCRCSSWLRKAPDMKRLSRPLRSSLRRPGRHGSSFRSDDSIMQLRGSDRPSSRAPRWTLTSSRTWRDRLESSTWLIIRLHRGRHARPRINPNEDAQAGNLNVTFFWKWREKNKGKIRNMRISHLLMLIGINLSNVKLGHRLALQIFTCATF